MSTIYALVDPRNSLPRYVGKTDNVDKRYRDHCSPLARERNKRANWLRKLKSLGMKPWLWILENAAAAIWQLRERFWITELRQRGFPLLNGTDGGEGGGAHRGFKHTAEARHAIGSAMRGKKHTPESKALISAESKSRVRTEATKAKHRASALLQWERRRG